MPSYGFLPGPRLKEGVGKAGLRDVLFRVLMQAMAYRLLLLAERSWRRLDAHELLPLVRAGVGFKDGVRVEREDGQARVLAKRGLSANKEKRGNVAA
jgi:hypothetical protein